MMMTLRKLLMICKQGKGSSKYLRSTLMGELIMPDIRRVLFHSRLDKKETRIAKHTFRNISSNNFPACSFSVQ